MKYWERGIVNNKSKTVMNITGASVTEATISKLNISTNYSIQVAAVNNAGSGVFSNATIIKTVKQSKIIKRFLGCIIKFTFSGVHLSLINKFIPNNSYVVMNDIGSTDDTALLCHTNKVLPKVIGGDWFDPDGSKVGDVNKPGGVPGVERNRGRHVVRLKRSSDGTPPEGVYKCVVRDTTDTNQTVYVGIYSLINGKWLHYVWCAPKSAYIISFLQASAVLSFCHRQC